MFCNAGLDLPNAPAEKLTLGAFQGREGIGKGLDQFAVSLIPGKPARLLFDRRDPNAVNRWSIHDLKTSSGFSAAVVVEGTDLTLKRFAWESFSSSDSSVLADKG